MIEFLIFVEDFLFFEVLDFCIIYIGKYLGKIGERIGKGNGFGKVK